ncbi:MAG: S-adenosylmethionine decarboxylase [Candidatus Diapherotrites archaeon]|nr:S-adenosylmethionine decarboxylase [Candidatus Diapherotrites archaeon]
MAIGIHILAEFYGCDRDLLARSGPVKEVLERAVEESELTKLRSEYHQFKPFGVTGFVLLAESHISIHTWPEHRYLALDVFTCGPPEKARRAFESLERGFKPQRVKKTEKRRGC